MVKCLKRINKFNLLIILCWLVYTCSYIGKLSYNANINQFGKEYDTSYSQTGMVSTFFFFAYGIGQVINGLLCKKYNIKYVIFISLIVSSIINILMVNISDFQILKFIWLINGIAMSFLWTSLIRLLSETLPEKYIHKAVIAMGTTVAVGTFIVYGMSSLFVAFLSYKYTFYIASLILLIVSLIWIFSYNKLVDKAKNQKVEEIKPAPEKINKNFYLFIVVLAIFAIANNFIKDGLTSWTPDILDTLYNTPGWLSILLTLLLPILAIGGTIIAVKMYKLLKDFILTNTILFLLSSILIGIVLSFISYNQIIITILSFSLVSCLMAAVNNIITSMVPLSLKSKVNSGMVAGILNGFCYLGSTFSTYGLGIIADVGGWNAVFKFLLIICFFVTMLGVLYTLIIKRRGKHEI